MLVRGDCSNSHCVCDEHKRKTKRKNGKNEDVIRLALLFLQTDLFAFFFFVCTIHSIITNTVAVLPDTSAEKREKYKPTSNQDNKNSV